MVRSWWQSVFLSVPAHQQQDFEKDCLQKNLGRFSVLPVFNILIQFLCVFIYLGVYPMTYPEKPTLNPSFYLLYSFVYILLNTGFALVLRKHRRNPEEADHFRRAALAVDLFLLTYAVMESMQVVFELSISGNLYRFLSTFAITAFMPVVSRFRRFAFMTLYLIIAELSLFYLQAVHSVAMFSYREIILVFYVICLLAANVAFSGAIRNYTLHTSLLESNQKLKLFNERLEQISTTDALTGIANRRALNVYAEESWKSAMRAENPVTVLMVDIDYFKKYNDTYGHQVGDDCLIQVANCIHDFFHRSLDMVARYGGEEFIVWLPHTTLENGSLLAESVRMGVERLAIAHKKNPPLNIVTISIGVASRIPQVGESFELMIKLADDALYTAKKTGRNRVNIANEMAFFT